MNTQSKLNVLCRPYHLGRVAEAAGIKYQTLISILRVENRQPRAETGIALARALGVDPAWLFDPNQGFPAVRVGTPLIQQMAEDAALAA